MSRSIRLQRASSWHSLPLDPRECEVSAKPKEEITQLTSVMFAMFAAAELVKPPDMTQTKVNKTLIALVAAKHVTKASNNVSFLPLPIATLYTDAALTTLAFFRGQGVVYTLDPNRHSSLA